MANPPDRTEHYRFMANEHRRLAANGSSAEARNYHRMIAENYSTLAGAAGKKTLEAREQRLATITDPTNGWRHAHATYRRR
jgi:hypothetical protein